MSESSVGEARCSCPCSLNLHDGLHLNPAFPIDTGGVDLGFHVNDAIVRALAGVASPERPLFLKMTYNGPCQTGHTSAKSGSSLALSATLIPQNGTCPQSLSGCAGRPTTGTLSASTAMRKRSTRLLSHRWSSGWGKKRLASTSGFRLGNISRYERTAELRARVILIRTTAKAA